ncbi:hypothetical protein Ddye_011663 [Dipteronia dyeriana]|uniref:HMA domain-containing protein n=1 Tax=Dipteronia dyeriana TaxID=168575 RepID=A0AAE0CHF5_9ROSI|nr:hypothetical protein Ddye_011663 [Dipteronia dyeriana]
MSCINQYHNIGIRAYELVPMADNKDWNPPSAEPSNFEDSAGEEESGSESTSNGAKQKVVIKVYMSCPKSRSRALKIAVAASGVESVALKGDDKNQIEITGDGIDASELTRRLRKKIGHAVLESVGAVAAAGGGGDKKKEEDKGKENEAKMQVVWPPYHASLPLYYHDSCGYSFI